MASSLLRCCAPLLVFGLLSPQLAAQKVDTVSFPLTAIQTALVEDTFDLTPTPGAFVDLMGRSNVVMEKVPLPGVGEVNLDLELINFDYSAMGVLVNGQPEQNNSGDLTLWKGTVIGDPGSEVMLGFSSYGSYGFIKNQGEFHHMIAFPAPGNDWSKAGARLVPDSVMTSLNVPQLPGCEADTSSQPLSTRTPVESTSSSIGGQVLALGITLEANIAIETDFEYYQNWNNFTAMQNYTNILLAALSDRYETSIDVVLTYPYVGYWTSNTDPWNAQGGGTGAMLTQFRLAWDGGNIPAGADLGHFISGVFGGGLAYLDVLCDQDFGFGVSFGLTGGTQFPVMQSSNTWDFYVVAHELGHNFGTAHTHDYCPTPLDRCADSGFFGGCQTFRACVSNGTIMSYCHTCSGGMNNITTFFHPTVISVMRAAALASCIPPLGGNCVADSLESNDTCGAAVPVTAGSYPGLTSCDDDDDYYRITVAPGSQVTCGMTFSNAVADLDFQLWSAGCAVLLDSSTSTTDAESVTWINTGTTTVDVVLREYMFSSVVTSNYDLSIMVDACINDDGFEDNDDCFSAEPMGDVLQTGLVVSKTDKDHYSACIAPGATLNIDVFFSTATADVDLFLWDASDVNCGSGTPGTHLANGFSTSDNEMVSYTNTSGLPLDVVWEVNVWLNSAGDCNNYDMLVSGTGCTGPGSAFCTSGYINSTGSYAELQGSDTAAGAGLHLEMTGGPTGELGYIIVGLAEETSPFVALGNGFLCLNVADQIGRYNVTGGALMSVGVFDSQNVLQNLTGTSTVGSGYDVPTIIPIPGSPVITAGETLYFQGWFRDTPAGSGQSNSTTGWQKTF